MTITCRNSTDTRYYDPQIHRKLYQNPNPFVLRRYNRRIKKCRGCGIVFNVTTTKFVISHREVYVYGRLKRSKHLLKTERDFFYHCDLDCVQFRHPYFEMCDIVTDSSVTRSISSVDIEHLLTHGIFV